MKKRSVSSLIRRGGAILGAVAALVLLWAWAWPEARIARGGGIDEIPPLHLPELVGEETAVLTAPPFVPEPITRDYATRVLVDLEVTEERMRMADGVEHEFWTFGGSVPGSFIRVREGDLIEFRLLNRSDSRFPHNIDLHAVTGPHGGGHATMTVPGGESSFTFRALNPGLYVYHCAAAPVPEHVARGMYGLILVEPAEGLPAVDHEYYVVQGDFYTEGRHGEAGYQPFSHDKLYDERPDYVLFNGAVGALMGDGALRAEVGETVRLFVGNGGPNLVSSFHVIGEIFDRVWVEGGTNVNRNVQTTLIPAGGAVIVDFRVEVPGTYLLVDHALGRVFNKGALASLVVEGPERPDIFDASPPARTARTAPAAARTPAPGPGFDGELGLDGGDAANGHQEGSGEAASAGARPGGGAATDAVGGGAAVGGAAVGGAAMGGAAGGGGAADGGTPAEAAAGNGGGEALARDGENRTVRITMREEGARMFFEPANVTVRPGDTVVFEQGGDVPHNVQFLADGAPAGFDLGAAMMGPYLMKRGETYEVVIDERFGEGDHPFVCTPHVPMGMTGVITVTR